jgi:pilus assembly protein TadC
LFGAGVAMVDIKKEDVLKKLEERQKKRFSLSGRLQAFFRHRAEQKRIRKNMLREQIEKAGLGFSTSIISRILTVVCIFINILITIYAFNRFYDQLQYNYFFIVVLLLFIWVLIFAIVWFLVWLLFYLSLDVAIFNRRKKLEDVLPDFLQLVSSNIRAGMTIDQALWFSVRPRFGVLAHEIEEVAKRTFVGEPLDVALRHFVEKYDSKMLERSINLLIEGLSAGGELGELLNKIASNINEINIMKKEMAANVTTYVIFITFATVVAAPFLFGMAFQLITVIKEVFSRVNISPGTVSGFSVNISQEAVSTSDFLTFAIVSLLITSFFSAIIVSTIKKGNIKAGIKYIPAFMISSVLLFLLVVKMFSFFVEGFF